MSEFINEFVPYFYVFTIIYFVALGCFMLAYQRKNCTHGEQKTKLRMTRSVGVFMLIWAFDWVLYLPIFWLTGNALLKYDGTIFIITMMLMTPVIFMVMHTILQKRVNTLRWTAGTTLPFLPLLLWYVLTPSDKSSSLSILLASVLNILFLVFLLIHHTKEYRFYIRRIKSEYSEISGRKVLWSWSCYAGFAIQIITFVLYNAFYTPLLATLYWLLSIFNAFFLCYCTCQQKTLDDKVVKILDDEESTYGMEIQENQKEKAFYSVIEQKLDSLCKKELLFLEPDLTRETLCQHLSISSTYLKMYFHSRGLSFYMYINTLRVEHAAKLMKDNPDMSILEVSKLSGFRSQTTFRKMFKEVMGCLPSEAKPKN